MKLKTEQEVIDLIGKETILKFDFMSEGLLAYDTVVPKIIDGDLISYEITFFYKELKDFFCYDSLSNFLSEFQIFELAVNVSGNRTILYHNKYNN